MGDSIRAYFLAGTVQGLLSLANSEDFRVERFVGSLCTHLPKQFACFGDQRDPANRPILCGRLGVATHDDLASSKIYIPPCNLSSFTFSTAGECQTTKEVRTIS